MAFNYKKNKLNFLFIKWVNKNASLQKKTLNKILFFYENRTKLINQEKSAFIYFYSPSLCFEQ